ARSTSGSSSTVQITGLLIVERVVEYSSSVLALASLNFRLKQGGVQRIVIILALVARSVDEKAGRAIDPALKTTRVIFFDSLRHFSVADCLRELIYIQSDLVRPRRQDPRLQLFLIFKNQVMHLPEFSLQRSGLCSLGREQLVRMRTSQRKIAKHKTQL